MYIFDKSPGDATAAGPGTTPGGPLVSAEQPAARATVQPLALAGRSVAC